MRLFRSVDNAQKWMQDAVKEEMVVPALSYAVVAEIEAQATQIGLLENVISRKSEKIARLEKMTEALTEELEEKKQRIANANKLLKKLDLTEWQLSRLKDALNLPNK